MHEAIVIGTSAGGINALCIILPNLPANFPVPIAIVQHVASTPDSYMAEFLSPNCHLRVKEAEDKEDFLPGRIYLAPADYHLLIETNHTLSLSVDDKVNFSRPAIDPLFESAAQAYRSSLIGIILTGANSDGVRGLKTIKEYGGLTMVQDPCTAENSFMPQAAIDAVAVDHVIPLQNIAPLLVALCRGGKNHANAKA